MNKQIDKGIIAIVITIILLILACLGYILFEKNNEIKNKKTTTTSTTIITTTTTKIIGKIDNNKEYVYDATYEHIVEKESYTVNDITYNINDYKAPFINLNSDYAKTLNNDIKKLYDEVINIYNEGAINGSRTLDVFKYDYYINDNILSLVITSRFDGIDESYNNYNVYTINLTSGEKANIEEVLKNKTTEEFINNVKDKILEEYNKTYENVNKDDELYKNYYETLKEETLTKFGNGENITYFIDNNNLINIIATISIPAERGYKDVIIKIDK